MERTFYLSSCRHRNIDLDLVGDFRNPAVWNWSKAMYARTKPLTIPTSAHDIGKGPVDSPNYTQHGTFPPRPVFVFRPPPRLCLRHYGWILPHMFIWEHPRWSHSTSQPDGRSPPVPNKRVSYLASASIIPREPTVPRTPSF